VNRLPVGRRTLIDNFTAWLTGESPGFGEGRMRARYPTVAAALLLLVGAGQARSVETTAAGLWQAYDQESGQPTGWFLFRDHDGVYDGTIVRMYLRPGESPNVTCDQCKDDRRGKPWLGLDIVRGMKRDGLSYTDGTILDPRNGNIYNALMTLTADGQTLVVRGYLGISLFGQNQYWRRLPDSAYNELDPRFNPNARKSVGAPKPDNSARR
jgi:Uncharacterized protein conserved in bacteria (DUF2147)